MRPRRRLRRPMKNMESVRTGWEFLGLAPDSDGATAVRVGVGYGGWFDTRCHRSSRRSTIASTPSMWEIPRAGPYGNDTTSIQQWSQHIRRQTSEAAPRWVGKSELRVLLTLTPQTGVLYFVTTIARNGVPEQWLRALDVRSGKDADNQEACGFAARAQTARRRQGQREWTNCV